MQFNPEVSGEDRRQRQRDYHAFLDAQVEARNRARLLSDDDPAADGLVDKSHFPTIPKPGRPAHQPIPPSYGVNPSSVASNASGGRSAGVAPRSLDDASGVKLWDRGEGGIGADEMFGRLEQRLEVEVQRRYLVERKLAVLGQKVKLAGSTCRKWAGLYS